MTEPRYLGPVEARWNDYIGTAAADDAEAIGGNPSLYQIAELDRDHWTILGVDLSIWDDAPKVVIYALDRITHQVNTNNDIAALAERLGELPVKAVTLASPQVAAFLNDAFKRVAIRLVARDLTNQRLRIDGELDR